MSELPYSNRELDEKFKNLTTIHAEAHKAQMAVLTRIETQTTKTNGRVGKLENWRTGITYASIGIWTLVIVIVIPLVLYAFNKAVAKPDVVPINNTTINK